jgi:hypothetical protein
MAPELFTYFDSKSVSKFIDKSKCDVFSVGLLALFCFDPLGFETYKDKNGGNLFNQSHSSLDIYFCNIGRNFPPCFRGLIRRMLSFFNSKRQNILELEKEFTVVENKLSKSRLLDR